MSTYTVGKLARLGDWPAAIMVDYREATPTPAQFDFIVTAPPSLWIRLRYWLTCLLARLQ